ncbi:uncharacterized protein LOC129291470 [Prosopis cineraria]|uniref:uncharacterized protein LOC129291470 n=1 Tax=Prosopis cineraria TaxID=364024 RepID=UPI0024103B38|nr:uncharacterized protein LOC129291470 [Prosopis cineraria]
MKKLRFSSFHRTHLLRFQKKMVACSSSETLGSVQERAPLCCCPGSSFLRQMVCKLKGRWNKALGWQRRSPHEESEKLTRVPAVTAIFTCYPGVL